MEWQESVAADMVNRVGRRRTSFCVRNIANFSGKLWPVSPALLSINVLEDVEPYVESLEEISVFPTVQGRLKHNKL